MHRHFGRVGRDTLAAMAQRPSFVPRELLVEPVTWEAEDPVWRTDVDPAALAVARLQHRLTWLVRDHLDTSGIGRETAAATLGMSRGNLWRLLDGKSPLTMANFCRLAEMSGITIELTPPPAAPDPVQAR